MHDITSAVDAFSALIREQLTRIGRIHREKTDFTKKETVIIGLIDGDGIGPIIMEQAVRVLTHLMKDEIKNGSIILKRIEGLTIEERMKQGVSVPDSVLREIKGCDVLLKGPTTTPKGGTMESANVCLRRELDLFANVRPVCIPEKGIDWVFFRENTEGEYTLGSKGLEFADMSVDFKVTSDACTERIAKEAFEYARMNGKSRVSVVTKANIIKKTDGRFSAVCHKVAEDYPEITLDEWYVDIMAANLINPSVQNRFEVIVLPNLYGDILTDEAAEIQGGVGTAGSANIGGRYAMFEAIHGSAPRMIEEGLGSFANPKSILRAEAMLLRHIGRSEAAASLENAMVCARMEADGSAAGATAAEYTDHILALIR